MKKNKKKPNVRTFYCPNVPDQDSPIWEIDLDTNEARWHYLSGDGSYESAIDLNHVLNPGDCYTHSAAVELNPGSRDPKDLLVKTDKPAPKKRKGFKKDSRRVQYVKLHNTLYCLNWKKDEVQWLDGDGWNPSCHSPEDLAGDIRITPLTKDEAIRIAGELVLSDMSEYVS